MSMTHRERMLRAVRGESTDRIPWAPRLDLWYKANARAGTLPRKYRHATLSDITDDLGAGFHAVVPDFRDLRGPEDDVDRALGIYNLRTMPFRTVLENVERKARVEGDRTFVEYRTPLGVVRTTVLYDEGMRQAGITITHVESHAFRSVADYAALGYIFENARVEPNRDGYEEFARGVGERGIAAGYVCSAASPMHLIQRELMPLELFFYEMHDHPEEMKRLAEQIGGYWERMLEGAGDSAAEVLFLGANYDASVTYPPFFAEHIAPTLRRFADMLHGRGKYLLTHADGENTGLLEHYVDSGIDIADSICPAPMTRLTFKEARDFFAGRITILGGIPSVALLRESMPDRRFERFLDGFFADVGRGDHLILGISDTTPPGTDFGRILRIGERVEAFGPVD
jgi:uroporphyrinogen-III decarboxylase